MDLEPKYTFFPLPEKNRTVIDDKPSQELLKKWGLNFSIQEYLFNEPFHPCHKFHLTEAFFKDKNVAKTLKISSGNSWRPLGSVASSVDIKHVPCTVMNMSFFDPIKNPNCNITRNSGQICKRSDLDYEGILISDNLRGMLLDNECTEYLLYDSEQRAEFIFRLFQMLVLGGELCQYEDEIEPYFHVTKQFYKDLIRVKKVPDSEKMVVATTVMEVSVKDSKNFSYFPFDPEHVQNNAFLLIDGDNRTLKTVTHQFTGFLPYWYTRLIRIYNRRYFRFRPYFYYPRKR